MPCRVDTTVAPIATKTPWTVELEADSLLCSALSGKPSIKEANMHILKSLVVIATITLLVACGNSPQQKKDIAEARLMEEQTKTIKEYKECIEDADEDKAKLDACERLLKVVAPVPAPAVAP